jgi:hypothetical protein
MPQIAVPRLKHAIADVLQRIDDSAANRRIVFDGENGLRHK